MALRGRDTDRAPDDVDVCSARPDTETLMPITIFLPGDFLGDVAHVRPSGNARQLRIYANSDSPARADQIVELGLREPDGILRHMERAFTQGTV
jgi:phosphomannomutase